jgi:hypothetical protein
MLLSWIDVIDVNLKINFCVIYEKACDKWLYFLVDLRIYIFEYYAFVFNVGYK